MKKLLKTGKKTLSVIMAVMMVLTAWVWVAPTEASAAAGDYYIRIDWSCSKGDFDDDVAFDKDSGNSCIGILVDWVGRNGTDQSSKGQKTFDLKGVVSKNNTVTTYSSGTISGFPTKIYVILDDDRAAILDGNTVFEVKKIQIGPSSSNLTTIWEGVISLDSTNQYKYATLDLDGNEEKSSNASISTTTENWSYPYADDVTWTPSTLPNKTCPSNSSTTEKQEISVVALDQYDVEMFDPTWSISSNKNDSNGLSIAYSTGKSNTINITKSANTPSSDDTTQTVTIKATWDGSGTDVTKQKTFTLTDAKYDIEFSYADIENHTNDTGTFPFKKDTANVEKYELYHGDKVTNVPSPQPYYDDASYYWTFKGWSADNGKTVYKTADEIPAATADTTYVAQYEKEYKAADYTALDEAIAAAKAIQNDTEYTSKYTAASRAILNEELSKVPENYDEKYGEIYQAYIDNLAALINAAREGLDLNTFAVIFLDNHGSILLYEKNAEYKSEIKDVPVLPKEQERYYDSENHYTYTGWDSEEYKSVVDDLVIQPVYEAQAHNFTRTEEVTSTCTQKGATRYICDCGYSYIVDKGDYGDHVWGEFKTDIHPTCTTAGQKSKYCTVEGCNAQTDITVIDPLGHQWGTVSSLAPETCDRDGINTRLCDACGVCEHTLVPATGHNYTKTTVAPTCTAKGYDEYTCANCGHSYRDYNVDMLDHTYTTEETLSAPACDIPGVKKLTCDCGHVITEYIDALSHDNIDDIEWDVIVAATCEYAGYQTKTCSKCGAVIASEVIPALTHDLETTTTPATCTTAGTTVVSCKRENCAYETTTVTQPLTHNWDNGVEKKADCTHSAYTLYTCQRENCGETKIEVKDESAPALGHDFSGEGVTTPATCTSGAYITYTCQREGCKETKVVVPENSAALGHDFSGTESNVVDATCTKDGSKTVKCKNCDATTEVILPKLGHAYGEWDKTTNPATNDKDGTWTRKCANCNDVESLTIPKGGHAWDSGTVTKAASCEATGTMVYKCTAHANCGITIEVTVPVKQHTIVKDNKAASCTESGWSKTSCSICNKEFNSVEIPATGHNYEASVKTPASCTSAGVMLYTCKNDAEHTYEASIPALAHDYTVTETAATCEAAGTKTYDCKNCAALHVEIVKAALGHAWTSTTHAATCTTTSYIEHKCGNDSSHNFVEYVVGSQLAAHNYVEVEGSRKAADCENNGSVEYKCSVCQDKKTEILPRLGHAYPDTWTVVEEATNDKDGKWTRECANCDDIETITIPKGGHTFGTTPDSKVDESCTTPGSATYNCKTEGHTNCGVSITVTVPVKQHTIAQKVTDATCTAKGWVESYCSVCDTECKKPFSTTEIPVIPHTYEEKSKEDATCTTSGYTVMACKCGASYNRYDADAPALGHDFTGDETIVPSTCTVNGSKTVQCSNCTETYTTTLPLANHKYVADGAAVAATCTTPATQAYKCDYCNIGYTEYVSAANGHKWSDNWTLVREATDNEYGVEKTTCTVAGCDAEQFRTIAPIGDHEFTATVTTNATCTAEGEKKFTCSKHTDCKANYTEKIPATGHTQIIEYSAPTCIATGTSKVVCSVEGCHAEILSSTIPVITYHNFSGNGVVTTDASCEGTGTMTYTCLTDGCNATKTEAIPAKGHTFETTVTDATCENPGSVVTFCSTCNDAKHTTTVELTKKNHAWNDGEIKEGDAATCEGTGTKTFTCSACNATKTETIPANGHSWSAWTKTDATATTDGYWKRTCSACSKTESLTIPRGHSLVRDDENSTAASCTAEGKEIYICEAHTDCGVKIEVTLSKLQHNYVTDYVDSTCNRSGYIKTSCTVCKNLIVDKYISPKAHTFDNGTKYPATCTDAAYHLYQCISTDAQGNDNCNYSYKAFAGGTDAAIGHNLVAGATSATCEGTGSQIFYCDRQNCGYSTSVEMPALGHNYVEEKQAATTATCKTPATKTYKCSRCTDSYTVFDGEKSATHNAWSAWTIVEATNTSLGYKTRTCNTCGQVEFKIIPATGEHNFNDETTDKRDATCTEDGYIVYACSTDHNCGLTSKVTIPATGHTEAFEYKAATCSKDGFAKMYCSTCTTVLSEQKIDKLGCSWVQGDVTPATCNTKGSIAYSCTRCTNTMSAELPTNANAHQYETEVTAATCYREGSVVTMCKLCPNKLSEETLIKTEHTWDGGTETTPATCTSKGKKTYECTVDGCNAEKTESIDALGHNWGNWFVETASTNTAEGTMKRECLVEGCTASETHTIPAGGHEWDDGKVTKEASCTETGTKVYACKNHTGNNACGITFTVTLDKLQHELTTSKTDATCLDDGKVITKCQKCDTTTITTTIPATGHTYNEGVKTAATCTSTGTIVYTCQNGTCKDTKTVTLDMLPHVYEQQGDAVAPTCTSSGYTNYKCKTCTSSYAVIGASATGHNFDDSIEANVTVVPSTCNTEGTKTVQCAYCGVTNTVKLPKSGHNYIKQGETVSATCKTPATETYKCEFCNDNYVEYVSDKLAEHTNWSAWTKVDATESSLGYQTRKCNTCGQVEFKIIPATGEHNFNKATADKRDATCTEDGYIVYACSTDHNCGLTSKVTVPATGHKGKLSYSAATCTGEGSTKIVCETCKNTIGDVETIPALGHLFNGTCEYVAATCVAEGSMTYTCTRCNNATHTTKIAVDPDAHSLKRDSKAASCKEAGYVNVSCENGCNYKEEATLPKLQHSWGEWSTVQASTNDSEGLMKRTCANGCTEEVEIPAGGHTLTEVARTNSTCTVPGFVTYECKVNHTGNVSCGIQVKVDLPLAQHTVKTEVIDASCTSEGTIKTSCSACNAKLAEDIKLSKLQHKFKEIEEVDATCIKSGYKVYKCENCNETYNEIIGNAKGHDLEETVTSGSCTKAGKVILSCKSDGCDYSVTVDVPALGHDYKLISSTAATCAAAATETYKCSRCEASYTVSVGDKLTDNSAHNWSAWTVVVEATYTTLGCESRSCPDCGKVEVKTIPATGDHEFTIEVNREAATCTEPGYIEYACSTEHDCDLTSKEILPATGHTEEKIAEVAATCTREGYSEGSKCTKCDTVIVAPVTLPKLGHAWGNEKVTPATCKAEGNIEYTCTRTNCNEKNTVVIGIDDAAHNLKTTVKAATCTEKGSVTVSCQNEGCTYSEVVEIILAKGHSFTGKETLEKAASCTENGSKTVQCASCNVTDTIVLPKLGHKMVAGEAVAATCTTSGYTPYTCENKCGESYRVYDEAVVEHNYVHVEGSSTATCLAGGTVTMQCSVCKDEITAAVPALGHSYGDWSTINPTASAEGSKTRECSRCKTKETVILPALGHEMIKDEEASTPATCTSEGTDVYVCTTHTTEGNTCGYTYSVKVPVIAHNYDESIDTKVTTVAPTCTENGSKTVECKDCNATVTTVIPRTGHTMSTTVTEATCEAEGSVVTKCTADGCTYKLEDKVLAKKPHTISVAYAYPSCTIEGYVKEACDKCDYEKILSKTPALGHSFAGEETVINPASCLENGTKTVKCSLCAVTEEVTIPATGHSYKAGDEVEATCIASGYIPYTCDCGSSYNVLTSNPKGHTWKTKPEAESTAATCVADGKTVYKCQFCDTKNEVVVHSFGHSWTPWTVSKAPTADTEGKSTRTCLREGCGVVETLTIPALGESVSFTVNFVVEGKLISTQKVSYGSAATAPKVAVKAPDADYHYNFSWDTDFTEVTADLTVNGIYVATGHTYGEWITDRPADCYNSGLRHRVCECKYIDEDVVAKLSHDLSEVVKEQPATCTENGYKVVVCKNCGTTETKTLNRLGHSMVYYEGYEATCDTEGSARHYNCTRCGKNFENREGTAELITTVIAKRHHTFVVVDGTTATCTSAGVTDYKFCTICGFVQHSETIPALGHADTDRNNRCDRCGILYENNGANICSCNCHKTGMINEIFYKILLFFWKLFGVSKSCGCGTVHY